MLFYQTAENIGQPGTGMKKSAMGVAGSRKHWPTWYRDEKICYGCSWQ